MVRQRGGDARACERRGWLTEAHEDEGPHQHDGSLSSVSVDDGRQTTWDTRARREQALSGAGESDPAKAVKMVE